MDSRITMGVAGVLLLGAVFAGYWGVHLSQVPASGPSSVQDGPGAVPVLERISQSADDTQRHAVVVAARELRPFIPLVAEDLAIERVKTAPPGSLSSIEQVLGRQLWVPLPAGAWLSDASFEAGGPLARMIRPGERAVAIAVDEVISASGFLHPGDYVDVLLVMQDESGNRERSAQVAVPALRLLSLGEELGATLDGKPAKAPDDDEENGAARSLPRAAVLAVPEQWLSRLMLASQVGTLRLAVRSAEEKLLVRFQHGEAMPVALDEKTRGLLPLSQLGLRTAQASPGRPTTVPAVRRTDTVEVLRAGQSTWQKP